MKMKKMICALCGVLLLSACQAEPLEAPPLISNIPVIETLAQSPPSIDEPIENDQETIGSIAIADDEITLTLPHKEIPLESANIPFSIANRTNEDALVTLIPRLDLKTDARWIAMPMHNIGFCGTPDIIPSNETRESWISSEWYEPLATGQYRLSFQQVAVEKYAALGMLSADFALFSLLTIDATPTGAAMHITNDSQTDYLYGEMYALERQADDGWAPVETVIENYAFKSIGYMLPAGEHTTKDIDWAWLYGELSPGTYRFSTSFSAENTDGTYQDYPLLVSFIIQ